MTELWIFWNGSAGPYANNLYADDITDCHANISSINDEQPNKLNLQMQVSNKNITNSWIY